MQDPSRFPSRGEQVSVPHRVLLGSSGTDLTRLFDALTEARSKAGGFEVKVEVWSDEVYAVWTEVIHGPETDEEYAARLLRHREHLETLRSQAQRKRDRTVANYRDQITAAEREYQEYLRGHDKRLLQVDNALKKLGVPPTTEPTTK